MSEPRTRTKYNYDSFGKQTNSTGSLVNPFRYTARESDTETGLYYYRARYYDPQIGRFLLEDPLYSGGEMSFYTFVGNDATNYVDPWGLCRILFNGSQISIETNNGSQKLGPFPAANKTVCNCGLKEGVYLFDQPQWLFTDGQETPLGASPFDPNRDRHQAFGSARIPLEVPGRPGIMIHSRYPDTPNLKPTQGCVRVHDAVASSMSQFIEAVCTADGPNSFHYFQRPW
jgi:RHS repeat-associated protein